MITSWKGCGVNDSWWDTTFLETGSISRAIQQPNVVIVHYDAGSDTVRPDKMVRLLRTKTELIKRHFPEHSRLLGWQLFRLWPLSRAVVLGVAGRMTGRADWRAVWDRRGEWQGGLK